MPIKKDLVPANDTPYPPKDGKRYVVSQQKKGGQKGHFLDFFESDKLEEAKAICSDKVLDEDRECVVFDRRGLGIIYRETSALEDKDVATQPTSGRGRC